MNETNTREQTANTEQSLVSIIIPTLNEEGFIGNCLRSISNTSYPKDKLEVLIADGMSSDNTRREILEATKEIGIQTRILDNPGITVPPGFNKAVREARGEIIIRLDAHCLYVEDYIGKAVKVFSSVEADNVGGPCITKARNDSLSAKVMVAVVSHWFGVGNSQFRISDKAQYVDTVPFGVFKRDLFKKVGLMDERISRNEDMVLNQRILENGGKIYLDPSLEIYYLTRSDWTSYYKHAWTNGFWNAMSHYLVPSVMRLRHVIPGMFAFYLICLLICFMLAFVFPGFGQPLLALASLPIAAYLLLDITATVQLGKRFGWKVAPLASVTFFLYHSIYGFGNLWGWWKVLRKDFPWPKDAGIPEPLK